jgi:ankyrin repeat protein
MFLTGSVNIDKYILPSLLNINNATLFIGTCKYSKNIINSCKKLKYDNDFNDEIILMEMCKYNKYKCVELLIKANVNIDINKRDINGWTALQVACYHGYDKCVESLIKANININEKEIDRWAALHFACNFGHQKCVELLIKDNFEYTALHYIYTNKHNECIKLLENVNS